MSYMDAMGYITNPNNPLLYQWSFPLNTLSHTIVGGFNPVFKTILKTGSSSPKVEIRRRVLVNSSKLATSYPIPTGISMVLSKWIVNPI